MKNLNITLTIAAFIFGLVLIHPSNSMASGYDKGSGGIEEGQHSEMKGSLGTEGKANVAISGYCPVCLINGGKVVKGNNNFVTEYDGKVYKFLGFEQQKMFFENPEKYIQNLESKFNEMKNSKDGKGSGQKGS